MSLFSPSLGGLPSSTHFTNNSSDKLPQPVEPRPYRLSPSPRPRGRHSHSTSLTSPSLLANLRDRFTNQKVDRSDRRIFSHNDVGQSSRSPETSHVRAPAPLLSVGARVSQPRATSGTRRPSTTATAISAESSLRPAPQSSSATTRLRNLNLKVPSHQESTSSFADRRIPAEFTTAYRSDNLTIGHTSPMTSHYDMSHRYGMPRDGFTVPNLRRSSRAGTDALHSEVQRAHTQTRTDVPPAAVVVGLSPHAASRIVTRHIVARRRAGPHDSIENRGRGSPRRERPIDEDGMPPPPYAKRDPIPAQAGNAEDVLRRLSRRYMESEPPQYGDFHRA